MKKILVLLLASVLVVGCGSRIVVEDDPYKNVRVIKMEMDHYMHFDVYGKSVSSHGSMYRREIKKGKKSPVAVLFVLYTSPNVLQLSKEVYMKIDQKIEKLALKDASKSSGTTSRTEKTKSLNVESGELEDESVTKVMSYNILSGKVFLTKKIESSILNAKKISYRLYNNDDPIEVEVSQSELKKIKEFLQTTEKKK